MSQSFQLATGNNTPTTVSAALGQIDISDPQYLTLHGGSGGNVLTTDGAAHLHWAAVVMPPGALAVDGVSILGDGGAVPLRVGAIDAGTY
jgi:hypothetical protein